MNKVVFICLLSLSMCLSDTNPQQDAKPQLPASNVPVDSTTQAKPTGTASTTTEPTSPVPASNSNAQVNASASQQTAPKTKENSNETKPNSTTPEKNGSTEKVPEDKEKKTEQPKDKSDPKVESNTENKAASAIVNGTTVDDKDKKNNDTATITTEKSVTAKTTEPAKAVTETPPVQARAFDGPSFVGGIILTLGILAICVMGYRYHKNQTERNYHTL